MGASRPRRGHSTTTRAVSVTDSSPHDGQPPRPAASKRAATAVSREWSVDDLDRERVRASNDMGPGEATRRGEKGWRGGHGTGLKEFHDSFPESQLRASLTLKRRGRTPGACSERVVLGADDMCSHPQPSETATVVAPDLLYFVSRYALVEPIQPKAEGSAVVR